MDKIKSPISIKGVALSKPEKWDHINLIDPITRFSSKILSYNQIFWNKTELTRN